MNPVINIHELTRQRKFNSTKNCRTKISRSTVVSWLGSTRYVLGSLFALLWALSTHGTHAVWPKPSTEVITTKYSQPGNLPQKHFAYFNWISWSLADAPCQFQSQIAWGERHVSLQLVWWVCNTHTHVHTPVFPSSQEVTRGEVIIFPWEQSKLDILITTSKKTKLGKGGGGSTLVPPFRGNTDAHTLSLSFSLSLTHTHTQLPKWGETLEKYGPQS